MLPPDTMHTTLPSPARPASAQARASAPAPSATTRARSAMSRTAAAVSSSEATSAPSSSSRPSSHILGRSALLPDPSTNDGVYSTLRISPAGSEIDIGAPVSGSAL